MSPSEDTAEEAIERRSIASLSLLYSEEEEEDGEGKAVVVEEVVLEMEDRVIRLDGDVRESIILWI